MELFWRNTTVGFSRCIRGGFIALASIALIGAVACGASAAATAPDLESTPAAGGVWQPPEEIAVSLNTNGFAQTTSVSCSSPGNCGAVGKFDSQQSGDRLFVANEVNGSWGKAKQVPNPDEYGEVASAISCPSDGDCFVVGENQSLGSTLVIDETNGTWAKPQDLVAGDLETVSCTTGGSCVAGGTVGYGGQALVIPEAGGTWGTAQVLPGPLDVDAAITSISCTASGDCTAGGSYDDQPAGPLPGVGYPLVATETGGTWGSVRRLAGPFDYSDSSDEVDLVTSVSCSSPGNCTAGGEYGAYDGFQQGFVASETAGVWGKAKEVAASLDKGDRGYLQSVSCPTNGNCAVAGTYVDASGDPQAYVDNEVAGSWEPAEEVAGSLNVGGYAWLSSVSCPSAGHCSAAGYFANAAGGFVALVVTELNGSWGVGQAIATSPIDDGSAEVNSISCPSANSCAAGGLIVDNHNYNHLDWQQAFVGDKTPS